MRKLLKTISNVRVNIMSIYSLYNDKKHREYINGAESKKVWGTTLEKILIRNEVPQKIDFISIDVEGGELPIISQLCALKDWKFSCGCVEHNSRPSDYKKISDTLKSSGYKIVWEGQTKQDIFFTSIDNR